MPVRLMTAFEVDVVACLADDGAVNFMRDWIVRLTLFSG